MVLAVEDGVDMGVCEETHHSISLKIRIFRGTPYSSFSVASSSPQTLSKARSSRLC